jgi:hypothetical protein
VVMPATPPPPVVVVVVVVVPDTPPVPVVVVLEVVLLVEGLLVVLEVVELLDGLLELLEVVELLEEELPEMLELLEDVLFEDVVVLDDELLEELDVFDDELLELLLVVPAGQVCVRLKTCASPPVGVPVPLSELAVASSRVVPAAADAKKNLGLVPIVPLVWLGTPPFEKSTVGAGATKFLPGSPAAGRTNTK